MSVPAVSVVMATYNGAALLGETLASLVAQTFEDWELVAVDDCSRDDTVELLRGFGDPRIRVIASETNGGPAVARNHAFAAARGHYVAGLDQDDVCVPERFARQVAYLDAHPEVALASTAAAVLEDGRLTPGNWPRPLTPGLIDWLILIQNPLVWSSVMFRADAARRLDPFERPEFRYVEDFDFYHRIRAFGRLAQIDEELVRYRAHAGGASNMFNATMRANAETLMRGHAPDIADLLVRHVAAREPVPDAATLARLFQGIARLRDDFGRREGMDPTTLALVDREISRLWWRLCRAGVRSGGLALHHALAARPASVTRGEGGGADLVVSQIIGGMRAMRRSLAARS